MVEVEPTQPHDVVLQAQRDADVLLLFMQERAGAEAVVPAKTWEYLAADRPVLALVPPPAPRRASCAAAAAGEVVAPQRRRRRAARHPARWPTGTRPATLAVPGLSPAARERISRRGRAAQLAALLVRQAAG